MNLLVKLNTKKLRSGKAFISWLCYTLCFTRCWFLLHLQPDPLQERFYRHQYFYFLLFSWCPCSLCSWLVDFSPGKDFPFSWFFSLVPIKELLLFLFFNKYHSCTPIFWQCIYEDNSLQISSLYFLSRHHDRQRDVYIHAVSSHM